MCSTASAVTPRTLEILRHQARSRLVRLFGGNDVLCASACQSDDLMTFCADNGDLLVSAILSVKYSRSALVCCPQLDAALGRGSASAGPQVELCGTHGERRRCPVVEEGSSPTVRRWRLAAELRQLREAKG